MVVAVEVTVEVVVGVGTDRHEQALETTEPAYLERYDGIAGGMARSSMSAGSADLFPIAPAVV